MTPTRRRAVGDGLKIWVLAGWLTAAVVAFGPLRSAAAVPQEPLDVLRHKVEQGLAVLNDPHYRNGADRTRQGEKIWALSRELFDFPTMARLVLSTHWQAFRPEQQESFVREFAAFLKRAYLPDLLLNYDGEEIAYVRQVMVSDHRAQVDLLVLWRNRPIPVTAKMVRREGRWRVYDLTSLGISVIQNYRAQFQWLMRQETPQGVIDILRNSKGRSIDE